MSDEKRAGAPDGKISVMVVDDDYLVRRAVPMLMAEDDIELIGVCETHQDAVELAARAHPQVPQAPTDPRHSATRRHQC